MSLNGPLILVVVGLLLVILVLSLYARHVATKDVRLFSEVARKRKGKITLDSFKTWAKVVFPFEGVEITVFQRKASSGKPAQTCIKCYTELSQNLSVHIGKGTDGKGSIRESGQWLLVPQVEVGSEEFNKEFVIHTDNRQFVQSLFSKDFQKRLLALKGKDPVLLLQTQKRSSLDTDSGKHLIEFSSKEVPREEQDLEKLIDNGLALIGRVLEVNRPL